MSEQIEVAAEVYGHPSGRLRAEVERFTRAVRRRRAAKIALPLIGGALLSLPIPGWHFIGVPGFLAGAFLLGRRRLRQDFRVESLHGACPSCGADAFDASRIESFPATLCCDGCGEFLKLEQKR